VKLEQDMKATFQSEFELKQVAGVQLSGTEALVKNRINTGGRVV
jgi:hypothetical protein